ncbi:MAG TPA: hypothetical protein QGF58_22255 [Myxococcota bacterium]|nr:hypothetical protein [Myxococcota bacterium]
MLLLSALFIACGDKDELDPDSYHWDIRVTGVENDCSEEQQGYSEDFVYSLDFTGSLTKLKIGYDGFATGTLKGCVLEYESQVVGEPDRAGGAVQWVLTGEAVQRTGGEICDMADKVEEYRNTAEIEDETWSEFRDNYLVQNEPADVDWVGIETFEIVASENESIEVGCTYRSFVAGKYRP